MCPGRLRRLEGRSGGARPEIIAQSQRDEEVGRSLKNDLGPAIRKNLGSFSGRGIRESVWLSMRGPVWVARRHTRDIAAAIINIRCAVRKTIDVLRVVAAKTAATAGERGSGILRLGWDQRLSSIGLPQVAAREIGEKTAADDAHERPPKPARLQVQELRRNWMGGQVTYHHAVRERNCPHTAVYQKPCLLAQGSSFRALGRTSIAAAAAKDACSGASRGGRAAVGVVLAVAPRSLPLPFAVAPRSMPPFASWRAHLQIVRTAKCALRGPLVRLGTDR